MARCRPRRSSVVRSHKTCKLGYRSDFEVNGKTTVPDVKNGENQAIHLVNNDGIRSPPSQTGKNTSHVSHINRETGEITQKDHLLTRWALQSAALDVLPDSRLRVCYRQAISRPKGGHVYRRGCDEGRRSAYYVGLRVCGSVWQCPVCAAKVSERRRVELVDVLASHRAAGRGAYLLTLTIPHYADQSCKGVLDVLLGAFRRLSTGKSALSVIIPEYIGMIRALEVTHGSNGWHPHLHILIFTDRKLENMLVLEDIIYKRWEYIISKFFDLRPDRYAAVQLQDGSAAARYVSKNASENWGIAEELTKAHLKSAGRGGRTPWAILADYARNESQSDAELFREYTEAFKGRAQLYWSRGLRNYFGLNDQKTDKILAEETTEQEDEHICSLSHDVIAVMRKYRLQGQILVLARDHGHDAVVRLLSCYGIHTLTNSFQSRE